MRCYTLIPRVSGTIKDWIELVPHISALGFDTIHLLPISKMGDSLSPYSSINPFEIDPRYVSEGTEGAFVEFDTFIDTLIAHKMKLCVDLVLNHLSTQHPSTRTQTQWFVSDHAEKDGIKRAGWSDGRRWHKWHDLALLDYESNIGGSLWQYMCSYFMLWAGLAAKTKGMIRIDNAHSTHEGFLEHILLQLRIQFPEVSVYFELFSEEHVISSWIAKYKFSFLLATLWEIKDLENLIHYVAYLHSNQFPIRYYTPVLSHDSGSIQEEYGSVKDTVPRMAVAAFLSSGDWGIVQGVENGCEGKTVFIGEIESVAWSTQCRSHEPLFGESINKINSIVCEYSVFRYKGNIRFYAHNYPHLLIALRYNKATINAIDNPSEFGIVFINLSTTHSIKCEILIHKLVEMGIDPHMTHNFTELYTSEKISREDTSHSIGLEIPVAEYRILYARR